MFVFKVFGSNVIISTRISVLLIVHTIQIIGLGQKCKVRINVPLLEEVSDVVSN